MRCRYSPVTVVVLTLVSAVVLSAQTNTFPSSGNVGIGTTSPTTQLTLSQANFTALSLIASGTGGREYRVGSTDNGNGLGGGKFNVYDQTANVARFVIDSSGNVGIGTASPGGVGGTTLMIGTPGFGSVLRIKDSGIPNADFGLLASTNGTTPLFRFFDFANWVDRMVITAGGNVGIGTTNPASYATLDVNTSGGKAIHTMDGVNGGLLMGYQGPTIQARTTGDGNTASLSLQNWGGNVGIGTATPGFRLHTVGVISSDQGSNVYTTLGLDPGASSSPTTYGGLYFDGSKNLRLEALSGGVAWRNIVLQGQGSGNVGIGTTNPTQKLSVAGTIQAKEVIVQTGWSDYVFEESYQLSALSETERFIKAKKHLPGIPSAQEVAERGVTLGDMQAKLLAKIEELTLHVIRQEKEIQALQAKLNAVTP